MTVSVAPPNKKPAAVRKPRDPDADVTLRLDPKEHERLNVFVMAAERYKFIKTRKMRRVSQSEAIALLLDQSWAKEIVEQFEGLAEKNRDHL